ncbi:GNAT family N-acetyltransferase [Archangium lipolyticum]|uniref:GNAT family N-acetyltransferase n=1 Tax=Archangium lipolyticum TaxID=2970465 RepID=UPI002149D6B4|nr:GNAT family N-acetyltransferase [Archangium lipolyticum]
MDAQLEFLFEGLIGKNTYYPGLVGPPSRVERTGHYAVIDSGYETDTFNLVISKRLGAEGPALADRICGAFNAARRPAAWWTCDELREDAVLESLRRHDFLEDEVDVGMVADLRELPEMRPPAGLEIKVVERPEEVEAFGRVIASLFEPPDAHVVHFYERVARLGQLAERPLKLFLGLVDGQPVGTSSLYLSGDGAHIFDISTRAEHRNRGYGSALTHYTLAFARGLGAKRGALQASPDGLGIYRRMGFREVCTFRIYSNKLRNPPR